MAARVHLCAHPQRVQVSLLQPCYSTSHCDRQEKTGLGSAIATAANGVNLTNLNRLLSWKMLAATAIASTPSSDSFTNPSLLKLQYLISAVLNNSLTAVTKIHHHLTSAPKYEQLTSSLMFLCSWLPEVGVSLKTVISCSSYPASRLILWWLQRSSGTDPAVAVKSTYALFRYINEDEDFRSYVVRKWELEHIFSSCRELLLSYSNIQCTKWSEIIRFATIK